PAPPLNDPLFLAIVPDSTLHAVVAEGRAGTPMPAFAQSRGGTLTDAQVNVLAAGLKPRWGQPGKTAASPPPYEAGTSGRRDQGAAVFERACAVCHGEDGAGMEEMAGAINDRAFLSLISDQALRRLAITGRPDLGMPDYAASADRGADYHALTS